LRFFYHCGVLAGVAPAGDTLFHGFMVSWEEHDMRRHQVWIAMVAMLASTALAETYHFEQHNGNLILGTHYRFTSDTRVEIMVGVEGEQFQFECYALNDQGEYVNARTIDSIEVAPNAGPVNVTVVAHHPDATFGAQFVELLALVNTGVYSRIEEFNIEKDLGARGATEVDEIDGPFSAARIQKDIYIGTTTENADLAVGSALADVYITGPGPHRGSIGIALLDDPSELDITGTMAGQITIGPG
jgi:hypothetical protein